MQAPVAKQEVKPAAAATAAPKPAPAKKPEAAKPAPKPAAAPRQMTADDFDNDGDENVN